MSGTVEMRCTCSDCPTQFEGTINGYPAYFRARWGQWHLTVAETVDIAVQGNDDVLFFCAGNFGDSEFAGSMPEPQALALMQACADIWAEP